MTVQISTLRVSAELDASNYVAGAAQKASADKSMVASGQELNVSLSHASDGLSKTLRMYADGHGTAAKFEMGIRSLNRALDTGKLDIATYNAALDGMQRKLGVSAEASALFASRQTEAARAMVIAEAQARRAAPANINAPRLGAGQLQGLGYQANDVVTMALMGAPLSQIAVSQGGQILQTLQMNEGGIMGSLRGIKAGAGEAMAAVTAFLGPVGLIATGFGAAAVAAGAFFLATREHTKTIDEALKEYEGRVRDIGDAYGYAARQAKSMPGTDFRTGDLLSAMSRNDLRLALTNNTRDLMGDLLLNQGGGQGRGGVNSGTAAQIVQPEFTAFANAIEHLRITAKQGTPDIAGFRDMVTKDWSLDPLNESLTKAASKLLDMTDSAMKAVGALQQIDRAQKAVFDQYQSYSRSRLAGPEAKAAQDANDARVRAERGGPYGNGIPIPTARPNDIDRLDSDPYAAMSRAMETRVRLAQQEASAVGLSGQALNSYRFEMDLLNDALAKNIELTTDQRAEIHKQAQTYAAATQQASVAKMGMDLSFERQQLFRSSGDQAIAARLRGTGLGIDSSQAQMMRDTAQLADLKSASQAFVSTFAQTLQSSGGDIGKSFGAALLAGLQGYEQKAIEKLGDLLFNLLSNALGLNGSGAAASGASAVGGIAANVAASVTGGAAANDNTYAAPIGTVTRSALPDVGNVSFDLMSKLQSGRPSSYVTGMTGDMQAGLSAMFANAPDSVRDATSIMSGARSIARQSELFNAAVAKYGSVAAARKWVAPPGHSQHNMGNAADLTFGTSEARDWFHENAGQYGMKFPMGYEPWHIETANARTGGASAALDKLTDSAKNATKGLGDFGTGASKMGSALSQFPSAPTGGGGLLNFAGSALSSVFSGTKAFNWLSSNPGGFIGLYDTGGYTGDGARKDVAGFVHKGEVVFSQDDVSRAGGVSAVESMRRNGFRFAPRWQSGGSGGPVEVHVVSRFDGDGNFNTAVEKVVHKSTPGIAQQQANKAVGQYAKNQKDGGAATMNRVYSADKAA